MSSNTIYVSLLNEGTDVWAPVDAEHIRDDIYQITDCRGEDDAVEFGKGALVKCGRRRLSDGDVLAAYEEINSK